MRGSEILFCFVCFGRRYKEGGEKELSCERDTIPLFVYLRRRERERKGEERRNCRE